MLVWFLGSKSVERASILHQSDGVGTQRHHIVPIGELNGVSIALVSRSGVISKSTDRIFIFHGGIKSRRPRQNPDAVASPNLLRVSLRWLRSDTVTSILTPSPKNLNGDAVESFKARVVEGFSAPVRDLTIYDADQMWNSLSHIIEDAVKDAFGGETTEEKYKAAKRDANKAVAKAKDKAYECLYEKLDSIEGVNDIFKIAKVIKRRIRDVGNIKYIKDEEGQSIINKKDITKSQTKVRVALKKMGRNKAVGPDQIPMETWKCLVGEGIKWLTCLFNKIFQSDKMPDEWRLREVIPIYKNKMRKCVATIETRERRLRWFGHVRRRPQQAPVRRVEALIVIGKRRNGRPKLRWEDRLKLDMKELLLSEDMTLYRNAWRYKISICGYIGLGAKRVFSEVSGVGRGVSVYISPQPYLAPSGSGIVVVVAELRASVFEAIEEEDKVIEKEEGLPPALLGSCNERARRLHASPSGQLLTALICEYLDWAQLSHTLKVYLPECNLQKDAWKSELKDFSNKTGYDINRNGDSGPLLLDVLEGFMSQSQATSGGRRSITPEQDSLSNFETRNRRSSSSSVVGGLPPLGRHGGGTGSSEESKMAG
ncbi:TONNEAU 1a-like protein [Tanacetum coccineum]